TPLLFAKGSVGVVPDKAYGLALCRGDANASACGNCIATSFKKLPQLMHTAEAYFGNECTICYSDLDFLDNFNSSEMLGGQYTGLNQWNITVPLLPGWNPSNAESIAA